MGIYTFGKLGDHYVNDHPIIMKNLRTDRFYEITSNCPLLLLHLAHCKKGGGQEVFG